MKEGKKKRDQERKEVEYSKANRQLSFEVCVHPLWRIDRILKLFRKKTF